MTGIPRVKNTVLIIHKMNTKGFTLIELLVSISIILMITGLSIATYTRSRERRVAFNEARLVADLIQGVKRKVLAGEKPLNCVGSSLSKYEVRINTTSQLQVWAICDGFDTQVDELNLLRALITDPDVGTIIEFKTVIGGVTEETITVCGYNNEYQIEVSTAGSVSAPVYVGSC